MSAAKLEGQATAGPYTLELIQEWPFGIRVMAGDFCIVHQDAYCNSSMQKTRQDCEDGVGFKWGSQKFTSREEAAMHIAQQDATGALLAASWDLREALTEVLCWLRKGISAEKAGARCAMLSEAIEMADKALGKAGGTK